MKISGKVNLFLCKHLAVNHGRRVNLGVINYLLLLSYWRQTAGTLQLVKNDVRVIEVLVGFSTNEKGVIVENSTVWSMSVMFFCFFAGWFVSMWRLGLIDMSLGNLDSISFMTIIENVRISRKFAQVYSNLIHYEKVTLSVYIWYTHNSSAVFKSYVAIICVWPDATAHHGNRTLDCMHNRSLHNNWTNVNHSDSCIEFIETRIKNLRKPSRQNFF